MIYCKSCDEVKIIARTKILLFLIQELCGEGEPHATWYIPFQIKRCLYSFIFFCVDICNLVTDKQNNTFHKQWRAMETFLPARPHHFPYLVDPPPDSVSLRTAVLKEFSFIWREFCVCVMWRSSAYCVCVPAIHTCIRDPCKLMVCPSLSFEESL